MFNRLDLRATWMKFAKDMNFPGMANVNPLNPDVVEARARVIMEEHDLEPFMKDFSKRAEALFNKFPGFADKMYTTSTQRLDVIRELGELNKDFWTVIGYPEKERRQELMLKLMRAGAFDFQKAIVGYKKTKEILSLPFGLLKEDMLEILERNADYDQKGKPTELINSLLLTIEGHVEKMLQHLSRNDWQKTVLCAVEMLGAIDGVFYAAFYKAPPPNSKEAVKPLLDMYRAENKAKKTEKPWSPTLPAMVEG